MAPEKTILMFQYLLLEWTTLQARNEASPPRADPVTDPDNPISTLRNPGRETIRQFVIYAENKVGWLNDFSRC